MRSEAVSAGAWRTLPSGPRACGSQKKKRAISADLREFIAQTGPDARAAHDCIQGLLEMLHGCPPGHALTAGYLLALLALVQAYLENVVGGMEAEGTD